MKLSKTLQILLAAMTLGCGLSVQAAIPPKAKILDGKGSQSGGVAGSGFMLTDMRRTADAKKKIERIVMDIGDIQGLPIKGLPGYFHVELKQNPDRLIIDLSQMPKTMVDEFKLGRIFEKSMAVQKTAMTSDPSDNTLNIALNLKKGTKVRVFQVAGQKQTSKIVVDLISK